MKKLIFCVIVILSTQVLAKKKVVYKYKEYEKFDLGDMEIKGEVVAPGDLSIKERRRKKFEFIPSCTYSASTFKTDY